MMAKKLVAEGKTKRIWETGDTDIVLVESKNDITAFDDPRFTTILQDKAMLSNKTTCQVFELLQKAGLMVAYMNQTSENEFLAFKTEMIMLECVARRYALPKGSLVQRLPHLMPKSNDLARNPPHRFHRLLTEYFLKTTDHQLKIRGTTILEGLSTDDPLIADPFADEWHLMHSKKPAGPNADLGKTILRNLVVGKAELEKMDVMLRKGFLVLEAAWRALGFWLGDIKFEFGIGPNGEIFISDVVDNDSWRLPTFIFTPKWDDYSKQYYRDLLRANPGGLTEEQILEVARRYRVVADLAGKFRIPEQALIIWTGSPNDEIPAKDKYFELSFPGVTVEKVVKSGHKQPRAVADEIDRLETRYPDGGVIIVYVGRGNGLGPTLAPRTTWPVISVPADLEKHPEDIWSSVRLASKDPHLTTWPFDNAVRAAMNHLAQKNPAVYAERRYEIEELDY